MTFLTRFLGVGIQQQATIQMVTVIPKRKEIKQAMEAASKGYSVAISYDFLES